MKSACTRLHIFFLMLVHNSTLLVYVTSFFPNYFLPLYALLAVECFIFAIAEAEGKKSGLAISVQTPLDIWVHVHKIIYVNCKV